ncbi:MAG: ParA family protein [Nitrospiraceae bacterium]
MAHVLAVANQKGGVGKTTSSINLAASLAINGHSTLLVDVDPQANASSGVGAHVQNDGVSVYDCLIRSVPAERAIVATSLQNLSVLPATPDLAGAEIELIQVESRELVLKRTLATSLSRFEYIILDCPPAFGLLTINALVAATGVVIPMQCEYYAMEGLGRLMASIDRVRQSLNPTLDLTGIVLTMYDARNSLARQVADEVRSHFKQKVFSAVIPRNVTLAEAPSYGRPAVLYNASSSGAQAYLAVAKELLQHGKESAG